MFLFAWLCNAVRPGLGEAKERVTLARKLVDDFGSVRFKVKLLK